LGIFRRGLVLTCQIASPTLLAIRLTMHRNRRSRRLLSSCHMIYETPRPRSILSFQVSQTVVYMSLMSSTARRYLMPLFARLMQISSTGWTWTGITTSGTNPLQLSAEDKPAGAWTAEQVAKFLEERMGQNKFYIVCVGLFHIVFLFFFSCP